MKAARLLALCCCRSARCRAGFANGGGVLAKGLAQSILKSVMKATHLQLHSSLPRAVPWHVLTLLLPARSSAQLAAR